MKILSYHVCPLWEMACGHLEIGFSPRPDGSIPSVVGWVVVEEIELDGEVYLLYLV